MVFVDVDKRIWKKIGLVKRLVLGVSTVGLSWLTISPAYSAQASAPTSTEMEFAIPAGSLADALTRFGRQTGIQISVNGDLARSMKSGGVSGEMTPDAALAHLLAGTGLVAHRSSSQNILIQKTSSAIMLGPVRVGGNISHQQDPSGPGVGYVATRTMTGSKTDTPIIEIPNSIHVITKQQMIDQQPQNVMEALRYMPGVSVEAFGAFGNGPASGLNPGAIQQRGFDTSQFVDGLRSYSNSAGETAFLERIEVMNGPSSVMYGQSTPGGMINMSLKKPTETPLHNATVGFGNWGRYEATVDVSDKINKSGSVKYRIAAIGVTQGSQTDHVNYHRVGILPSISWNIDEKTNLAFVGSYMYTPGDGTNWTQLPPEILLNTNHNGRIPRSRFLGDPRWNVSGQKDAFIEYQFQHKFNKWIDFSQNLRWERSESFEKRLTRGRIILPDQYGRAAYEGGGLDSTVGLDTRVGGKFSIKNVHNTWLVGTDFRQYNDKNGTTSDHTMGYDGFPGSNGYSFVNVYDPQSNYVPCINVHSKTCRNTSYSGNNSYFQEGVYFQDQIKWKNLSVTLGGRQDWVNYHGYTDQGSNQNTDHAYIVTRSHDLPRPQSAFTWRAGLVYKFSFGLAPYFSYSTSFVPQSFGQRNWEGKLFPPLTGKQLEAGMKYESPDHNIFVSAAAFRIDEDHFLVNDPDHDNFSSDAGKARSQGFEISANANITHDLRFNASYTYDEATYLDSNLSDTQAYADGSTGSVVAEKGKYVESIPRNMVSAFLDYTPPARFLKGFGINGGVRYKGFTYSDAVNSYKVPAYVLFDIGAHYDFGQAFTSLKGLRAQLSISNLTNKYYIASCGGTYSCYIGQGRRVYGNLSYSW